MAQLSTSSYPRSRMSALYHSESAANVVRSRVWAEDIVKDWNEQVTPLESLVDRVQRYMRYFTISNEQAMVLCSRMQHELEASLEDRILPITAAESVRSGTAVGVGIGDARCSSLEIQDTHLNLSKLSPVIQSLKGSQEVVDFSGTTVTVGTVTISNGSARSTGKATDLREEKRNQYKKGLADPKATAMELFDCVAQMISKGPVSMSIGFPVQSRWLGNATLQRWTRGMATGRDTNDGVEGADVAALLECALQRRHVEKSTVTAVVSDAVAALVAGTFESGVGAPACRVSLVMGSGMNSAMLLEGAENFKFYGDVINTELGGFDNSLPLNDIDLEVDFADLSGTGVQLLEKMTGTAYLGELCRRLILKVWQNEAPTVAWQRRTLPWCAAARVVYDQCPQLSATEKILRSLWDWDTTLEVRSTVQQLWEAVFDRAAALAAVSVVALAKRTGYLQPAMGGVTVVLAGELFERLPPFVKRIETQLRFIMPNEQELVHFHLSAQATMKGAAILGIARQQRQQSQE